MGISLKTHKLLWGRSGNRCAFPNCGRVLAETVTKTYDLSVIGDVAHIIGREVAAPRGNSTLPIAQRDEYDNLLLLCKIHHKIIDDQPGEYTVEKLKEMKNLHERWVYNNLSRTVHNPGEVTKARSAAQTLSGAASLPAEPDVIGDATIPINNRREPLVLERVLGDTVFSMLSVVALNRLKKLNSSLSSVTDSGTRESILRAEAMRSSKLLPDYLKHRYQHLPEPATPLMSRTICGHVITLPGLFLPSAPTQTRVNHLLGEFSPQEAAEPWNPADSRYFDLRTALRSKIYNHAMFSLTELSCKPSGPSISAQLTKYVPCLVHQDALEWELLSALGQCAERLLETSDFGELDRHLPLRHEIEQPANGSLFCPHLRPSGLAISTLIVFRDNDDRYRVFFGKRSSLTANHSDLFHVVPACMFQPELGQPLLEWNLEHSILKEYGEELFGEELNRKAATFKYFYTRWPSVVKLVEALRDPRRVELLPTGVFFNLLNHRAEVCALLLIHDSAFWQGSLDDISLNWEYHERQSIVDILGRGQTFFDLEHAEDQFFSDFPGDPGLWVPPGLAAFFGGIERAREKVKGVRLRPKAASGKAR